MRAIRSGRLPATQIDDGDYSIDAVQFARIFSARPLMRDAEARDQIVQDETSSTMHDNSSEARSPPTILADPPESRSGRTLASHLAAIRAALVRFSADQPATNEKPVVNARAGFTPQSALTDSPPTSDEPASVAGDASFGAAHDSEARGELLATPIRPPPTPPESSSHELENPRAVEPMAVDSVSDDLMATLAESPDARVEPTLRPIGPRSAVHFLKGRQIRAQSRTTRCLRPRAGSSQPNQRRMLARHPPTRLQGTRGCRRRFMEKRSLNGRLTHPSARLQYLTIPPRTMTLRL